MTIFYFWYFKHILILLYIHLSKFWMQDFFSTVALLVLEDLSYFYLKEENTHVHAGFTDKHTHQGYPKERSFSSWSVLEVIGSHWPQYFKFVMLKERKYSLQWHTDKYLIKEIVIHEEISWLTKGQKQDWHASLEMKCDFFI